MTEENKHIVPIELITRVLAGEANPREQEGLRSWLTQSADNQKEFDGIKKLWDTTPNAHQQINIDAEWSRMESTIAPAKGKVVSLNRILQIAAAIIILLAGAFLLRTQLTTTTIKTAHAETKKIVLSDGSTVNLNAGSKLSYGKSFGEEKRAVQLTGEGFFNITSNKEIPFVVLAQGTSIEVVGTQFNVRAYKNIPEVKVTVVEGKVAFTEKAEPAKKVLLAAGETGTFSKDKKILKKKPVVDVNDMAWKTYSLSFTKSSLTTVVDVLENTYHVKFRVANKVKDCTITVNFEDKDLKSVLKVLQSTLGLRYKQEGDVIIIDGDGC